MFRMQAAELICLADLKITPKNVPDTLDPCTLDPPIVLFAGFEVFTSGCSLLRTFLRIASACWYSGSAFA